MTCGCVPCAPGRQWWSRIPHLPVFCKKAPFPYDLVMTHPWPPCFSMSRPDTDFPVTILCHRSDELKCLTKWQKIPANLIESNITPFPKTLNSKPETASKCGITALKALLKNWLTSGTDISCSTVLACHPPPPTHPFWDNLASSVLPIAIAFSNKVPPYLSQDLVSVQQVTGKGSKMVSCHQRWSCTWSDHHTRQGEWLSCGPGPRPCLFQTWFPWLALCVLATLHPIGVSGIKRFHKNWRAIPTDICAPGKIYVALFTLLLS